MYQAITSIKLSEPLLVRPMAFEATSLTLGYSNHSKFIDAKQISVCVQTCVEKYFGKHSLAIGSRIVYLLSYDCVDTTTHHS